MISVTEALTLIRARGQDFGTEAVLLHQSIGRVLAEDVAADRDFPPYHRVTMDGIAVSHKIFEQGRRHFKIEQMQPAGHPQQQLEEGAHCIEVMTGAVVPLGTDAVVPYEDCILVNGIATVTSAAISPYQNIHRQGMDAKQDEPLVQAGARITAAMTGILASVGKDKITVQRLPKIAVCATGDELVPIHATPLAHQVRMSNSYMLVATLHEEGIIADSYHLPDNQEQLHRQITALLQAYDVLLFSGAVSKGKYDFLPQVLDDLGMETILHRVAQKPGKPFLFGKFKGGALVFGFPGNPVSTLVCYKIFFRPWLHLSLKSAMISLDAQLAADVSFKPALTYHLLVTLKTENGILLATSCAGANSGDMVSLQRADAILTLPANKSAFKRGEAYPVTLLAPIF